MRAALTATAALACLAGCVCSGPDPAQVCGPRVPSGWGGLRAVPVVEPDGGSFERSVEEPEVRDFGGARWLFFNDSGPGDDKNLYAARWDDAAARFVVQGPLPGSGVNTAAVDGNPSLDRDGNFYFVSPRGYPDPTETIFHARLEVSGEPPRVALADVRRAPGLSRAEVPWVSMGVHVGWDGEWLFWDEAQFDRRPPTRSDIVAARRTDAGYARLPDAEQVALLGAVNSERWLEYAEFLSPDGLALYFTRAAVDRVWLPRSVMCLMVSQRARTSDPFGPPTALWAAQPGPGVVLEAPALSPDGRTLYFHRRGQGEAVARLHALDRE